MFALLGLDTIYVLLATIMFNKMSPPVALIAVPVIGALIDGFWLKTGKFFVDSIQSIVSAAAIFVFAI
ncbi:MAG: hypothetical protein LBP99_06610 [Azoarcus sp.]|jgi:CitMHS family citrate-Mg2+:H+ or citrate-Ca2+:H+ symporter|nr:hypothetical protein [Azoarcus sp.]